MEQLFLIAVLVNSTIGAVGYPMTNDAFNRQVCYDRSVVLAEGCMSEKCLKRIQSFYCVRSTKQPKLGERAGKYGEEIKPERYTDPEVRPEKEIDYFTLGGK